MFGWIRGRSEDLDYTLRSATVLLHNPVSSLFALSLPVCSVATETFPTVLWASELGWGRCCDVWKTFTPQGRVWYNKPVRTATAPLVNFIQTNLGVASNTLHRQSGTIFPRVETTPASPWTWQVVGAATAPAQQHAGLHIVQGFLACARENQPGNGHILQIIIIKKKHYDFKPDEQFHRP